MFSGSRSVRLQPQCDPPVLWVISWCDAGLAEDPRSRGQRKGLKRKETGFASTVEPREGSFISNGTVSHCSRGDGSVGMGQGCGSE